MRILYDNKVLTANLSRSSELNSYPITNLQRNHLTKWFKTQGCDDEWIKIPGPITASYIVILAHNLTSSATVTLQANTSDSWTSPALEITLTVEDTIIEDFTEAEYAYWRVLIDDPTNPAGNIRIGGLFLGTYLQMPGMKIDQEIIDQSTTETDYSATRQLYADIGIDYTESQINHPNITWDQYYALRTMWQTVGKHTPIIILIWEADLDLCGPIYCHLTENPRYKRQESSRFPWSTSFKYSEVF